MPPFFSQWDYTDDVLVKYCQRNYNKRIEKYCSCIKGSAPYMPFYTEIIYHLSSLLHTQTVLCFSERVQYRETMHCIGRGFEMLLKQYLPSTPRRTFFPLSNKTESYF